MKKLFQSVSIALVAALSATASYAAVMTSRISMDNSFVAYISTSDTTQGTQFSSGANWEATVLGSTVLAAGTDYYLHIRGNDAGGVAGFLGSFSLSGTDHAFANGLTSLSTNTTYWSGNNTGFSGSYAALISEGLNGVGPWGVRPNIASDAQWIWAGNADLNDVAYFTTKISAVPEPTTVALLSLGLLGFAASRRKAAKK